MKKERGARRISFGATKAWTAVLWFAAGAAFWLLLFFLISKRHSIPEPDDTTPVGFRIEVGNDAVTALGPGSLLASSDELARCAFRRDTCPDDKIIPFSFKLGDDEDAPLAGTPRAPVFYSERATSCQGEACTVEAYPLVAFALFRRRGTEILPELCLFARKGARGFSHLKRRNQLSRWTKPGDTPPCERLVAGTAFEGTTGIAGLSLVSWEPVDLAFASRACSPSGVPSTGARCDLAYTRLVLPRIDDQLCGKGQSLSKLEWGKRPVCAHVRVPTPSISRVEGPPPYARNAYAVERTSAPIKLGTHDFCRQVRQADRFGDPFNVVRWIHSDCTVTLEDVGWVARFPVDSGRASRQNATCVIGCGTGF